MTTDRAKTNNNTGVGIAIGVAIGVALGTALDQLALGIAIGTAFGASIDLFSHVKRKKNISTDSEIDPDPDGKK
jgi:hypothetical protein